MARNLLGGVETYLASILPALVRAGHEVTLGYEQEAAESMGALAPDQVRMVQFSSKWAATLKGEEPPDVVLLNGLWNPLYEMRLVDWAPTVYFAHNFWGVCISGSKRWGRPFPKTCTRSFGPGCLIHYLPHGCGGLNPFVALEMFSAQSKRLGTILRSRAVLVASEYMRREYERNGVAPERINVIPPFVREPEEEPQNVEQRRRGRRLVFLGRMTQLKGPTYLVRAAHELNSTDGQSWTVVFGGDGPERERVLAEAKRLDVPLECAGWVDASRRDELLRSAALLVLPSTWPEPFGIVGLEAARLGVPSVAFGVGGIPEWLESGVNGELAEFPASVRSLADAVRRATSSEAHYRQLCHGATERSRHFSEAAHFSPLLRTLQAAASASVILP